MPTNKTNKEVLIKLEKINFYYNYDEQAIFDLNLNILANSVHAFIGPSGCGKSTILRMINRMNDLIPRTRLEGKIYFQNQNIYHRKQDIAQLRAEIGMIFQKPTPFPMSIYENVAYGPKRQGIRDKKLLDNLVIDSLKKAAIYEEIAEKMNESALSLSGGQQQRVCLARAIAMKPKVLLMDEPTSALDPIATAKIEKLIKELKKDFTIVIVTHHMQQAMRVSNYTSYFDKGKLIEHNVTKQIFTQPKEKQTNLYISGRYG